MKRIGVLGGSSDQATADYYRRLNAAVNTRLGGWHTAELVITSMDFAFAEACVRLNLWDDMAEYLADRAVALERAGADVLICVSNTLHRLADRFMARATVPLLHIADPTARAIREAGLSRVALLGTKPVMATDDMKRHYRERFGIDTLVPDAVTQDALSQIIFEELCRGRFTAESKAVYLEAIDAMRAQGAEGVILGCTEIPLLVGQADRPAFPMFDTTGLHVDAVVDWALDGHHAVRPAL